MVNKLTKPAWVLPNHSLHRTQWRRGQPRHQHQFLSPRLSSQWSAA